MTIAYFTGFETAGATEISTLAAGASIQGTTVRTGGYALKQAATLSTITTGAFSSTQTVFRFYFRVPTLPGADTIFFRTLPSTSRFEVDLTSGGNVKAIDTAGLLGFSTATGTAVLAINTWYRIEVAVDLAASGVIKVWVDGVLDISTTHTTDKTANPTVGMIVVGAANPNEYFFDDIRIDTGTLTAIGAGQCIARQPITGGTPTYDTWTKSSGTDAGALWDNTPFDTTDFCSSATAANAQTAVLSSFGSTQSGHGTETLGSGDTINASKIALVGKTSSITTDGADSIRRRVAAADTDVAVAVYSVSDDYRDTGIITGLTYTNLTAASTEMGAVHGTGVRTHTVEDMWWMIDYTPVAVVGGVAVQGFQIAASGMLVGGAMIG